MSIYSTISVTREKAEEMISKKLIDLSIYNNTALGDLLDYFFSEETLNNYIVQDKENEAS